MKIALDYDNTYTAATKLWDAFVKDAISKNHAVRIVTYRSPTSDNDSLISAAKRMGVKVMYTSGTAKRKHCSDKGWEPDIWIDDKPESILEDSTKEFSFV